MVGNRVMWDQWGCETERLHGLCRESTERYRADQGVIVADFKPH